VSSRITMWLLQVWANLTGLPIPITSDDSKGKR